MREKAILNDYRIVEVIQGLTPGEIKKLKSYLSTPYFNKSKKLIDVFNFLSGNLTEIKSGSKTKKELWSVIYKDKKFNDSTLRKLMFEFATHVRNFILQELVPQSNSLREALMLRFYRSRKMLKNFEQTLNQSRKNFDIKFVKFSEDYYESLLTEMEAYNFAGDNLRHNAEHLNDVTQRLNNFFILNKLEHFYDAIKYKEAYDTKLKFKYDFKNDIQEYFENNLEEFKKSHPNIYLEYLSFRSVTELDAHRYIKELNNYLVKNESKLNKNFLKQYYIVIYNFHVNRINKGDDSARKNLLDITKILEEKNLTRGIFVAPDLYLLTSIITALSFNETEWAEAMIKKYEKELPKKSREDAINIAYAYLKFQLKEYIETLRFLSLLKKRNTIYYLYANVLAIKTYYELGEYEPIYSLADTTNHFLDRKTIAEYSIQGYKNFLKFILKLIKPGNDEFELNKIRTEIEKYNILNSKDWLLEKLK